MKFDIPSRDPRAAVVNHGRITVAQKGFAALVAPGVANSGVIQAKLGKVVLAGAETYTVDFYGDGLIKFDVGSKVATAPRGRRRQAGEEPRLEQRPDRCAGRHGAADRRCCGRHRRERRRCAGPDLRRRRRCGAQRRAR